MVPFLNNSENDELLTKIFCKYKKAGAKRLNLVDSLNFFSAMDDLSLISRIGVKSLVLNSGLKFQCFGPDPLSKIKIGFQFKWH